nr:upf0643 protein [Quercus suber]
MAAAGVLAIPPKDCLPAFPKVDDGEDELQALWPSPTQLKPILYIDATHIVSSPYQDFTNQLNLQSLERPVRLFALALMVLRPIRLDFRTGPYMSIFNWSEVFHLLRTLCTQTGAKWPRQEFYVVIFRSKLRNGIDRDRLGELDQRSHEEACASGGLLKYWFGTTNEENRNLATCKLDDSPILDTADKLKVYGAIERTLEQVAVDHGTNWPGAQLERCTRPSASTLTNWSLMPMWRAGDWKSTNNEYTRRM